MILAGENDAHFEERSDDSVQVNLKKDSTMVNRFTLLIVGEYNAFNENTEVRVTNFGQS